MGAFHWKRYLNTYIHTKNFGLTLWSPDFFGCLGLGEGGGVSAVHISKTIEHIGMKLGVLAENHKLIKGEFPSIYFSGFFFVC